MVHLVIIADPMRDTSLPAILRADILSPCEAGFYGLVLIGPVSTPDSPVPVLPNRTSWITDTRTSVTTTAQKRRFEISRWSSPGTLPIRV
jgi:hypothetical protein